MSPWNPDLYLKFEQERTQPIHDLVSRIHADDPKAVVDLGCGPGNSTRVLRDRWPSADLLGVDNSTEMIEKARETFPQEQWLLADIRTWRPEQRYDVIFSGATLQWLPDHRKLMPRLFSYVGDGGVFAVQLPANRESPLHQALLEISRGPEWRTFVAGCEELIVYQTPEFYYDVLSALSSNVQMWTTTYYHVLTDHRELLEWYSSTGLRPYLERLPDESRRDAFQREILKACAESYPEQDDGRILYPFQRFFFIVRKT
jgi:trans-aconitate 2-methyltransferase